MKNLFLILSVAVCASAALVNVSMDRHSAVKAAVPTEIKKRPGLSAQIKMASKPLKLGDSFEGNTYDIVGYAAQTNNGVATNLVWPKRVHIDLSTDGGSNYTHRVAYGIPSESNFVNYSWCIPWWDKSLLTETAMLRITDLSGTKLAVSFPFIIAGIDIRAPVDGDVLTPGTFVDLTWFQSGAGSEVEMGYITPESTNFTSFITFSNCVAGLNSISWEVNLPWGISELRLVLRSIQHPLNVGHSGIISTP